MVTAIPGHPPMHRPNNAETPGEPEIHPISPARSKSGAARRKFKVPAARMLGFETHVLGTPSLRALQRRSSAYTWAGVATSTWGAHSPSRFISSSAET